MQNSYIVYKNSLCILSVGMDTRKFERRNTLTSEEDMYDHNIKKGRAQDAKTPHIKYDEIDLSAWSS